VITLNRPQRRNGLTAKTGRELAAALDRLGVDAGVRAGVLTGAGGAFCSGMDLEDFGRGESATIPGRGLGGLTESPPAKPLIAAVEGPAVAGGLGLALACDLVVASHAATFGLPEVSRGLGPDLLHGVRNVLRQVS
jgi:enoyl-CoA hydratase